MELNIYKATLTTLFKTHFFLEMKALQSHMRYVFLFITSETSTSHSTLNLFTAKFFLTVTEVAICLPYLTTIQQMNFMQFGTNKCTLRAIISQDLSTNLLGKRSNLEL